MFIGLPEEAQKDFISYVNGEIKILSDDPDYFFDSLWNKVLGCENFDCTGTRPEYLDEPDFIFYAMALEYVNEDYIKNICKKILDDRKK